MTELPGLLLLLLLDLLLDLVTVPHVVPHVHDGVGSVEAVLLGLELGT